MNLSKAVQELNSVKNEINDINAISNNTLSDEEMYQVLNWINVQYTDEFEQIMFWGPESEGLYTTDENGKRVFPSGLLRKIPYKNARIPLTFSQ